MATVAGEFSISKNSLMEKAIARSVQSGYGLGRSICKGSAVLEGPADQLSILPLYGFIAFARCLSQGFYVHDLDFASGVFDKSGALERVGHHGNACASYPQHLRQIFLSEGEGVAARQIPGPQQPSAKSGLHVVSGKACCRLLCLRIDRLLMTDKQ